MLRPIHPDFAQLLELADMSMQTLYRAIRACVLQAYPDANELLYHTHALSSVYSTSRQLKHGFCHIAIYSEHMNLGFNYGTMLDDPTGLLQGTGKTIRHVPVRTEDELQNPDLIALIEAAVAYSLEQLGKDPTDKQMVISKIKK